jgi:hypothetical protein
MTDRSICIRYGEGTRRVVTAGGDGSFCRILPAAQVISAAGYTSQEMVTDDTGT